ncbi:DUF1043 family protein [Vibrio cholerae]
MPWIYALVGLLVGAVLGVLFSRISTPGYKKQKNIQKDLDNTKFQLEQQKQDLTDHFAQTAEMLDALGKEYTKLYQHMAKTSGELLPNIPEQDNPFVKKITEQASTESEVISEQTHSVDTPMDEAPKDYAQGATGLLKEQKKPVVDEKEVLSAKAS